MRVTRITHAGSVGLGSLRTTTRASFALLAALSLAASGCASRPQAHAYVWNGLDEASGQNMRVEQGPMPENGSFTGVYRSPQIGDVEMVQTGNAVVGRYEYDRGSCHVTARFEGTAEGNLLRLRWTENHRPCGRIAPVVGRAYFLYMIETTGDLQRGRIFGRWGYDNDDQQGGPWLGFKLPNRTPHMLEEGQDGSREAGSAAPSATP